MKKTLLVREFLGRGAQCHLCREKIHQEYDLCTKPRLVEYRDLVGIIGSKGSRFKSIDS